MATDKITNFGNKYLGNDGSILNSQVPSSCLADLNSIYPVGALYFEVTGINPGITFNFGTWTLTASGSLLVGSGAYLYCWKRTV